MKKSLYPALYQINTRVWLTELSEAIGRQATLDDIPDPELDRLAEMGFDYIWFLSVWTTGEAGRDISRLHPGWRADFVRTLADLREEDIGGSGFAIAGYHVAPAMGGDEALARLRERLRKRDLKLMLDFVPNHMGPDHPWVNDHPEWFVAGTEEDMANHPQNYTRVTTAKEEIILAYGRDPYFPGWPDTVQLDYSNPETVEAMTRELIRISGQCDGVRCDMAMLVLPEVFERTWGRRALPFWSNAINAVRQDLPDLCFMAEVYRDMEWDLQQEGFNYAYDKRLYDRLVQGRARPVREHLHADLGYQQKLARFLENHDEPRAAATFVPEVHKAAAVITYTIPGLRFFHHGQLEGKKTRISPHLVRGPQEATDPDIEHFYNNLLKLVDNPLLKTGKWQWLESNPAWATNPTNDSFVAHCWQGDEGKKILIVVNYSPYSSQCYLRLQRDELGGHEWLLKDLLSDVSYKRNGYDLISFGLYLDLPAWHYHAFEFKKIETPVNGIIVIDNRVGSHHPAINT
jgi:hypothetical protein